MAPARSRPISFCIRRVQNSPTGSTSSETQNPELVKGGSARGCAGRTVRAGPSAPRPPGSKLRGQPCPGLHARERVRAANFGPISARRPRARSVPAPAAPGPAPPTPPRQQWQLRPRRLRAELDPGRGGAEPRGILESAGRWGFWEENSISSFPAGLSPPPRHPKFPCVASRAQSAGVKRGGGRGWENAGHVRAGQVLPEVLPGSGRDGALHGPQSEKGG